MERETPSAPIVETERFILRRHREDDLPAYIAMRAEPEVFEFTTGRPVTEDEAWMRFMAAHGHWATHGYGMWAIEEKVGDRFIGEAGFVDARRNHSEKHKGLPEVGWWLAASRHGKGYATEVVRAIHLWADRNLNARCTFCVVIAQNVASLRLAEGIGYSLDSRVLFLDRPSFALERALPLR